MEFVPNTIALHNYLIPAHEKYYPKDLKSDQCRKAINEVSTESNAVRVRKYKDVTERFSPVMRYFFLERFENPDHWFEKRLAYTRSTAAISILGHVLGLGDRHCHNILLDEHSGEVVHIDLGIAFEAGRVLPVPEVVPFRLTRDIVDGMGYTKTEGVFRRCCEFTLDALREEREGIMTLLNVLRYDPLVNWSLSVSKARRLQDGQGAARDTTRESRASTVAPGGDELADQSSKKKEDDAGEAGRALSVVEKKLSKALSTAATVNELIQQATDERNLAVLFCGECTSIKLIIFELLLIGILQVGAHMSKVLFRDIRDIFPLHKVNLFHSHRHSTGVLHTPVNSCVTFHVFRRACIKGFGN
jgi:ataxia telangiectasia mutated family protein